MTELESRTICVDLDRTLCLSCEDYSIAEPVPGAQKALGLLRKAGWIIVLYTARHFNHWQLTVDWLSRYEFGYDQIVFGKPPARFYIDDRAISFDGDWEQLCQKIGTLVMNSSKV